MFEQVHIETVYPATAAYPWPNLRLVDSTTPGMVERPATAAPERLWEASEQMLIIGGVKQHALDIRRATATTARSHSLAIEGTVSHDSYQAKVESRRHIVGRALSRALDWMGIRRDRHTTD